MWTIIQCNSKQALIHQGCILLALEQPLICNNFKVNEVAQSCLTLCHPMDCSLLAFSVHEIFQARTLEWVASSVQFNSVAQSCPTLCSPMNRSTPGLPVHHQLLEFTQTHVHRVGDAIQPSHPLSSPSPPAPNPFQHQGLFQWINSSHDVAKVLDFQL